MSSGATPAPDPADPSPKRLSLARSVVIATVLGALVFAGLSMYGDVNELRRHMTEFHATGFLLALALATGNYLLRLVRWEYYLRQIDVRVPLGLSALVFFAGFVMSVTPGKVGEVFKSLLLYESRGISIAKTAPVVVAERLTDLIALVAIASVGALTFEEGGPIALGGGMLVLLGLVVSMYRPAGELVIAIARRTPVVRRFAPRLQEAYESLYTLSRPAPLLVGTLLSLLAWGLEVAALVVIVGAFPGAMIEWDAAAVVYSASTLAGALAMMPGGLGVTEAGMTGLLLLAEGAGAVGIDRSLATAVTMLTRLATLWWAVVLGLVALGWYRARARRQPTVLSPDGRGSRRRSR